MLNPLFNSVLFTFIDDQAEGKFIDRSSSGIILTNHDVSQQGKKSRWGRIIAIGPDVLDESIQPGQFILVENLKWTMGFKYEEVNIWMTTEDHVLAITDDINDTFE